MIAHIDLMIARQALAVFGACLGAYFAVSLKSISHRTLCLLISFAAGCLLAVSVFDIVPETIQALGLLRGAVSLFSGYAFFWIITRFVAHVCPACSATHTEVDFKAITVPVVAALGLHSFMDGLAIYSSFMSSSVMNIQLFLAVFFHKLPEGMALTLVARASKMPLFKAFLLTAGIEALTTFGGGFAGIYFVPESSLWPGYILGHVGGGFIFLAIHALLSEVFKHHPRTTVLAASGGVFFILGIGFLTGAH